MNSIFLFVLGTIVGSFLNVIAMRWPENVRANFLRNFGGRSRCSHCSRVLSWFELIPIVSFVLQKGRCRNCRSRLSYQYPITEILTGLVFITVPLWLIPTFSIYIIILLIDFHRKIIPDELVYASIFLALVIPLFIAHYSWLDWLAGPIIFLFFGAVWLISRGRVMGFGDAKLGLSVGFLLGAAKGFSAITFAFWSGAAFSILYMLLSKTSFIKSEQELTMKSEVPFAPFIILGAWLSLFYELNIFHVF